MSISFQMKAWRGWRCSFTFFSRLRPHVSPCMFILAQVETTLETAAAARGSVPDRIPVPLGATSQLEQLSCSPARPPRDTEPRTPPTLSRFITTPLLPSTITSPSKCGWRPEGCPETPPKRQCCIPCSGAAPSQQILGVRSLRVGDVPPTALPRKGGAVAKQLKPNHADF